MAIDHLDTIHQEMPEVFKQNEIPEIIEEGFVILPIGDPDQLVDTSFSNNPSMSDDDPDLDISAWEIEASDLINTESRLPDLTSNIAGAIGGTYPGSPVTITDKSKMPPPEWLAFYLPFHYYYRDWWGVYLIAEGVQWLAEEIVRRSKGAVPNHRAWQAARLFLYHHEAFHHKVECFGLRLETTHREALYKKGFEDLYKRTLGTDQCLEEGLANASALAGVWKTMGDHEIHHALEGYVKDSPPGYRMGNKFQKGFENFRADFAEMNQNVCFPHLPPRDPGMWLASSYMFTGISNIKSRVNYVVKKGSPLLARLRYRPLLPPRKIISKLNKLVGVSLHRNGGNHDIYRATNGCTFPMPRHAKDLKKGTLRSILQQCGLQMGLEEFQQY